MIKTGALAAALTLAATPALTQDKDIIKPGEERFTVVLGAFLPAFDTDVKIDHPTFGSGTNTNLRDDFGVERDGSSLLAGFEWRFAQRHRLGFNYARFKLDGSRTATRNIQIGDEIYPAGAQVSAETKIQIIPITYSYSFLKRENQELAATIGLHWSNIKFRAQGSTSGGGFDTSNDTSSDADLPLPLLGLRYDYHFSPRWSAGAHAAVFAIKYDSDPVNAEGSLWSVRVHGEYRFSKHFGVGAAIEAFAIDAQAGQNSWQGNLDYRYWGPQIYLTARF